ncbi:MAG: hypothetical protein LBS43_06625 [Prevotellaceae bacterium]|jgi:hypothetical protein|nr:hypothetical protein [Prevotellaceae bacterium]
MLIVGRMLVGQRDFAVEFCLEKDQFVGGFNADIYFRLRLTFAYQCHDRTDFVRT